MIYYIIGLLVACYFLIMGFFQTGYPMLDYNPVLSFIFALSICIGIIGHIIYFEIILKRTGVEK